MQTNNSDHYKRCELEYIDYLEKAVNIILRGDDEGKKSYSPSTRIKRFLDAKEFLKEFTKIITDGISKMKDELREKSSKEEIETLENEIAFKNYLLRKYNVSSFDLLDQLIDGEEKRLPQISESVQ